MRESAHLSFLLEMASEAASLGAIREDELSLESEEIYSSEAVVEY
jgi:hypothetical protein